LGGQSAIDSERCRWQRTVDALGADDKPKNARKNHIYHQYQLRSIQRQERQEFSGDQPSEGLGPRGEQGLQGRGSFKSERYQEEELPVSIRVKVRGKPSSSKEKQEAAAGRSPEVPVPAPDSEQKPRGAETFKRQTVQGQDPPVHISRTMAIQTEGAQEANEQIQEQDSQDGGQGDTYVKRITAIGNRHWPGLAGRKPRDPEDPALRKLYMGYINADTDRAAMQSYFEKFGAVERCYRTTDKEANTNKEYGFVVFRVAAMRTRSREPGPIHSWDGW
jgi:hypothetical protein